MNGDRTEKKGKLFWLRFSFGATVSVAIALIVLSLWSAKVTWEFFAPVDATSDFTLFGMHRLVSFLLMVAVQYGQIPAWGIGALERRRWRRSGSSWSNEHLWKAVIAYLIWGVLVVLDGRSNYKAAMAIYADDPFLKTTMAAIAWIIVGVEEVTGIVAKHALELFQLGTMLEREIAEKEKRQNGRNKNEGRTERGAGDWFAKRLGSEYTKPVSVGGGPGRASSVGDDPALRRLPRQKTAGDSGSTNGGHHTVGSGRLHERQADDVDFWGRR